MHDLGDLCYGTGIVLICHGGSNHDIDSKNGWGIIDNASMMLGLLNLS